MIPVDEETALLLSDCRHELSNIVQSKFGCTLIFHNVENSRPSENQRARRTPDTRYSVKLPKGLAVSVWMDDLTTHRVDAVVNAANQFLSHKGGLALALSNAGGPQIQSDSSLIIANVGKLHIGDAVVTHAGHLPCKRLIHAVGPELSGGQSEKEVEKATSALKKAVFNILKKVEEEGLRSVAIPAISSGLFNFPLKCCADTIVKTLKEYHDRMYTGNVLEVRLVNHDEFTVCQMERACREILGSDKSYSTASVGPKRSSAEISVQVGNAQLHVKQGFIERERVDVIVNSVAHDLNLSSGGISKAILSKAGSGIQREIIQKARSLVSPGDVIQTHGHKLDCDHVFHAVCADTVSQMSRETLTRVVETCLHKACSSRMKSISFPAIGTGLLNFPKSEAAHIMVREAASFAMRIETKMHIFFVLFPSDHDILKAFKREIGLIEDVAGTSRASVNDSKEIPGAGDGAAQTPCIEVCGGSSEQMREAKSWICKVVLQPSGTHTILNNHILHFGLKEYNELLSIKTIRSVAIKEFVDGGLVGVTISPHWVPNGCPISTKAAVLAVEALCCQVQEDFARAEEDDLLHAVVRWQCEEIPTLHKPVNNVALERAYLTGREGLSVTVDGQNIDVSFSVMNAKDTSGKCYKIERKSLLNEYKTDKRSNIGFYQKKLVEPDNHVYKEKEKLFPGLKIVKVEKVENPLLEHHFRLKQQQLGGTPKQMYKQVSAQFCDLVCRVGFQKTYSPLRHQKFGAGIYFYGSTEALRKHKVVEDEEAYTYIFEAQVLPGKSTRGSPGLTLPPPLHADPFFRYDSLTGNTDTHVVFNSRQALPQYLITCTKASASERH
ncbi:poly ADP-ribose polymerase 9 isoform X1 [Arapaima gigas]